MGFGLTGLDWCEFVPGESMYIFVHFPAYRDFRVSDMCGVGRLSWFGAFRSELSVRDFLAYVCMIHVLNLLSRAYHILFKEPADICVSHKVQSRISHIRILEGRISEGRIPGVSVSYGSSQGLSPFQLWVSS